MPRRQKLRATDQDGAQEPPTNIQTDYERRVGRLRSRGWEINEDNPTFWQTEAEKQEEQQQQQQQQLPRKIYRYQQQNLNRRDIGSNLDFQTPIEGWHQLAPQTNFTNFGLLPQSLGEASQLNRTDLEHQTAVNITSMPPLFYESNRRQQENEQISHRIISNLPLNYSPTAIPYTYQNSPVLFESQDPPPPPPLFSSQLQPAYFCQPTGSVPLSNFQQVNRPQRVDQQPTNFIIASDAVLPMDDSHPNLFRTSNISQKNDFQNPEQFDKPDLTTYKKKNSSLDQAMETKTTNKPSTLPAPQSSDNDDDKDDKSPLPQNLRGDPFRSAKVKTELCRHWGTEKGCPFGDKCNYAHGEHELKYTKLMDLERAGLVDVEIFRTHPCTIWVATGSCPFDQRCSGLHDPRISSPRSSWLPHAETLVNSVGTSANVDKLYHQQLSAVYSCSPIYNYIPKRRWKSDPSQTFFAWRDLYAYVCNLSGNATSWDYDYDYSSVVNSMGYPLQQSFFKDSASRLRTELVRVLVALKIRERKKGQSFAYLPTHLFCGELCMVLQTRAFKVPNELKNLQGNASIISEIDFDPKNVPGGSNDIVVAREIAFGPVGDPGIRQVSIWFNIEESDLVPCTSQQAKRHKRSRHRLKKDRGKERSSSQNISMATKTSQSSSNYPEDDIQKTPDTVEHAPFFNYQPVDADAFNLVTSILIHRSQVILLWILNPPKQRKDVIANSLRAFEHQIESSFSSQRRHWMTWSWPINQGRDRIDEDTDVPPVTGEYELSLKHENNPCVVYFHGKNDGSGADVVSSRSKLATFIIWKSFLYNMKIFQSDIEVSNTGEFVSFGRLYPNKRRLPVLRNLSMGRVLKRDHRILPSLKEETSTEKSPGSSEEGISFSPGTIGSLFHEWKIIENHYETGPSSSQRSSRSVDEVT